MRARNDDEARTFEITETTYILFPIMMDWIIYYFFLP